MANTSFSHDTSSGPSGACFKLVPIFDLFNMTDRPNSVKPFWTFLAVVNAIASPITVVINALVIWAILGSEEIRSYTFNLLLAALAVTDFFVGLVAEPLFASNLVGLIQEDYFLCTINTVYFFVSFPWYVETLLTLAIASVERYLAIEHPNVYQVHQSRNKVVIITAVMWLVSPAILLGSTVLVRSNSPFLVKVPYMIFMVMCGLIVSCCTGKVFRTAYHHSRAIAVQVAAVQPHTSGHNKEHKKVFTFTILVLASVIFYCPFIIVTAIEVSKGTNVTDFFKYTSMPISLTFIHIQSLVNPIIMSLRLSYIRQRIKNKLLGFN